MPVAYTEDELNETIRRLEAGMARVERGVTFSDRSVTYTSRAELLASIAYYRSLLADATGVRRRNRQFRPIVGKGL